MTEEESYRILAENKKLHEEIESIYNSRSWKITRPLRFFGKAVRRAKKLITPVKRPKITNQEYLSRIADNEFYCSIPESEYPERLCVWYKEWTGEVLHLENPITFNEKINWMKLYDKNPLKTLCADKYLAPKWAKKQCPELHTVKILKSWKRAKDIDFSKLPQKFVLKCNHGSGMNIIVTDKSKLNIPETIEKLNFWMLMDYAHWNHSFEIHYSKIKRRIICEEYMESDGQHGLLDYKIHCFNGEPEFIQVIGDRNYEKYNYGQAIFDLNWNNLHIKYDGHSMNDSDIERPSSLFKMIEISRKLSSPFKYVRVDLYVRPDGIYFGELTFAPAMGVIKWDPSSVNIEWGRKI